MSTMDHAAHGADLAHAAHDHHEQSFIKKYVFSTDHKIIGIQFLGTTLLMLLLDVSWPRVNVPIGLPALPSSSEEPASRFSVPVVLPAPTPSEMLAPGAKTSGV